MCVFIPQHKHGLYTRAKRPPFGSVSHSQPRHWRLRETAVDTCPMQSVVKRDALFCDSFR